MANPNRLYSNQLVDPGLVGPGLVGPGLPQHGHGRTGVYGPTSRPVWCGLVGLRLF